MNDKKIVPINKTQWLEVASFENNRGISVMLANDYMNNIVRSLAGVVCFSGADCFTLTFSNLARQMRARLRKGKTKYKESTFKPQGSLIEVKSKTNSLIAVASDEEVPYIRLYVKENKYVYPLISFSVDNRNNAQTVNRVILGKQIPCIGNDILFGIDLIDFDMERAD